MMIGVLTPRWVLVRRECSPVWSLKSGGGEIIAAVSTAFRVRATPSGNFQVGVRRRQVGGSVATAWIPHRLGFHLVVDQSLYTKFQEGFNGLRLGAHSYRSSGGAYDKWMHAVIQYSGRPFRTGIFSAGGLGSYFHEHQSWFSKTSKHPRLPRNKLKNHITSQRPFFQFQ